jgi:bifunctional DNA-binding transcriptional regulator/antitoxin component of YhaV-PrlF toxin-antitoxin module
MKTIQLTSKRQATFPVEVCEALQIRPGDRIGLVPRRGADGAVSWELHPVRMRKRAWVGAFRAQAQGKAHDMAAVRKSIARGRAEGGTER